MNRRTFLRRAAGAGAAGAFLPGGLHARALDAPRRLVVLHTNDTHSRMDPFPMDGGPFEGQGGAARRGTLIQRIRNANEHVLLVDSGDVFQGTPYFNFFGGELEFRAMSAMGYDVGTLGNHDFDNGVDGLADMLPEARFDIVSANYDVHGTRLDGRVKPWVIREYDGLRVGIFGLGIDFAGLVLADLHAGVAYHDPIAAARGRCGGVEGGRVRAGHLPVPSRVPLRAGLASQRPGPRSGGSRHRSDPRRTYPHVSWTSPTAFLGQGVRTCSWPRRGGVGCGSGGSTSSSTRSATSVSRAPGTTGWMEIWTARESLHASGGPRHESPDPRSNAPSRGPPLHRVMAPVSLTSPCGILRRRHPRSPRRTQTRFGEITR